MHIHPRMGLTHSHSWSLPRERCAITSLIIHSSEVLSIRCTYHFLFVFFTFFSRISLVFPWITFFLSRIPYERGLAFSKEKYWVVSPLCLNVKIFFMHYSDVGFFPASERCIPHTSKVLSPLVWDPWKFHQVRRWQPWHVCGKIHFISEKTNHHAYIRDLPIFPFRKENHLNRTW